MPGEKTVKRKAEHLDMCVREDVETGSNGFSDVTLVHRSLPELELKKIDTSTSLLGKKLSLPLVISGMTGGVEQARKVNRDLAAAAQERGIAFGVGSQRAMIERPELKETYYVRDVAPDILLFGNMGITQIAKYEPARVRKMLEDTGANALCVHLNPAQEVFQTEGDWDFTGTLPALRKLCRELRYPVIGKEVGHGISRETAKQLKQAGVAAIDVGGSGGTNWAYIEAKRAGTDLGEFKHHGIPTAAAVLECRKVGLPIIATGGIRSGLEIAKAIALGATCAGMALPFLRAQASGGKQMAIRLVDRMQEELGRAMFLAGCRNIRELSKADHVIKGDLYAWASQRKLV
ncbi:type 2 isopentenyl-diphosphate Delta-isomerase [Candidatus Micrarchaeota archaeon]|nr:type 2 isopentenyl-diphosphate Delta-isomerase [Candidatus Micrarchaeota archaeon]